ncbi:DNA-binding XRE family transcriptional regulator [Catenulispora sp. MAP5-51]|uniref:helix-turn-helix domain-containing protein n=1 Tax=Catenulispora sp. MAP5-51 TaxID=3156298 RepID=UPI0035151EA0
MLVFVDDAAESVVSADVEVGDVLWVGDRCGHCTQWCGLFHRLMSAVAVVVGFVLVQGVQQVALVLDQGAVQQLTAAGLHPPFHNRVHSRYADATEHDVDPCMRKDLVEQRRELRIPVSDQVLDIRRVPPPELGPMLKAARARAGLGLREAAHSVGITHSYLIALERGARSPSIEIASRLTEVLQLSGEESVAVFAASVPDCGPSHPLRLSPDERVVQPR